jgi:uncharacterized protein YeaO (DUF488 family)
MPTKARVVKIRRIYEPPTGVEGYRALVDRLWPRGVKASPELFDEWAKDAAPSADLRRWYGHEPAKFAEFARRYRAELDDPPARGTVQHLADISARGPLTLLTATKDVEHSGALVLAQVIEATSSTGRARPRSATSAPHRA